MNNNNAAESRRLRARPAAGLAKTQIAALAGFFCLAGFLIFSAFYTDVIPDEAFYWTIPQRMLQGDRLLVEEWHVSQLSAVFQLFPYWLYTTLTGGTEGLILAMRFAFVAVDLALYCYFCRKLRPYGVWGVAGAALFCSGFYLGIATLNYYNMSLQGLAVVCMLLFFSGDALPRRKLVFAGVVLSCAVVIEPTLSLVYLLFSLLVLLRRLGAKKGRDRFAAYAFVLDGRVWLWMSVGVLLSAAAFIAFLALTSGIGNIVATVPELFTDSEYYLTWYGNSANPLKWGVTTDALGTAVPVALLLLTGCAVLYRVFRQRPGAKKFRLPLFYAAQAALIASYAAAIAILARETQTSSLSYLAYIFFCRSSAIPFYLVGLIFFLLREKTDRRLLSLWATAVVCSASVDYFSEITVGFAARLGLLVLPAVYGGLLRELKTAAKEKKTKAEPAKTSIFASRRFLTAASGAAAALMLVCAAAVLCAERDYTFLPAAGEERWSPGTVRIESGPLRGLRNTDAFQWEYDRVLADLDRIRRETDAPVYVAAHLPYAYLYLNDLPSASYTSIFVSVDFPDRIERYWTLFGEKKPEYIYLPYDDFFSEYVDVRRELKKLHHPVETRGDAGLILRIE